MGKGQRRVHLNSTGWRRRRRRSGRRSARRRKGRRRRRRRQRKRKNGIVTVMGVKELRAQKWRGQEKELKQEVRGVILWTRSAESNCLFTCQHHNGIILSINCAMA